MDVGIGLPTTIPGVRGEEVLAWARRAEAAGFSSLGTIDRVVYPSYESFISLAAAAAVTERIKLVTDILIAPLRSNTALFAKQAATIDHLSGGRLELGLAVGGRPDDYEASGVDFGARGRIFDRQLEQLTRHLGRRGRRRAGTGRRRAAAAADRRLCRRRVHTGGASYADGWTMGGGTPDMLRRRRGKLEAGGPPRAARAARGRWCSSTSRSATTLRGPRAPASATTTRSWATTRSRSSRARPRTPTR